MTGERAPYGKMRHSAAASDHLAARGPVLGRVVAVRPIAGDAAVVELRPDTWRRPVFEGVDIPVPRLRFESKAGRDATTTANQRAHPSDNVGNDF